MVEPQEPMQQSVPSVELVRQAQAGDSAARNRLFERYYARVLRIVRVRLGAELRRELESCDAVQETFLAALHAFDRFEMRDDGALVHWLATLAERRIRDAARRQAALKRDPQHALALADLRQALESGELTLEPANAAQDPGGLAARGEEAALVDEELALLSEPARELVLLRNVAGASWQTVAERGGFRTERAARVAHAKALVELGLRLRQRGIRGPDDAG